MATKLFLRNTQANGIGATYYDMIIDAGSATDTAVVNTTAAGTEIQFTKTAGGSVIQFVSGRAPAGGFTLTTTDISLWMHESNMNANIGGRYRVFKRTGAGVETELGGGPFNDGVEFGTSAAEMLWTGNVTDTAFAENDRILLKIYITNVGTMATGFTGTLTFNGADGATGDSFFNIAETITFKFDSSTYDESTSFAVTAGLSLSPANLISVSSLLAATVGLSAAGGKVVSDALSFALALNGSGSGPQAVSQTSSPTWTTNSSSQNVSVAVQAGDLIVVAAVNEYDSGSTINTPTNDGAALIWTERQHNNTSASKCEIGIWTAVADSTRTIQITVTQTSSSFYFGFEVYVFRNASVGNSTLAIPALNVLSTNITTTQANSAVVVIIGDFQVADGASRTWKTAAGSLTETVYQRDAGHYTVYSGYHPDAGAVGTYSVGVNNITGAEATVAAIEIKGGGASNSGLSPTASLTRSGDVSFAVTNGLTTLSVLTANGTISLPMATTLTPAGTFVAAPTVSLATALAIAQSGGLSFDSAMSLATALGISDSAIKSFEVAVALGTSLGLSDSVVATMAAQAALNAALGLNDTGNITSDRSVSFQVTPAMSLAGTIIADVLAALSTNFGISGSSVLAAGASIPFNIAVSLNAAGNTSYNSSVAFAATTGLAATSFLVGGANTYDEAVTMGVNTALQLANQLAAYGTVTMVLSVPLVPSATGDLQAATQLDSQAGLTLAGYRIGDSSITVGLTTAMSTTSFMDTDQAITGMTIAVVPELSFSSVTIAPALRLTINIKQEE
jgi:hypothetical protein